MVVSFSLFEVVAMRAVPEEQVVDYIFKENIRYIHIHHIDKLDSTP